MRITKRNILTIFLIPTIFFLSSCTYYTSRLDLTFEKYGYTNCEKLKEINFWWDTTNYYNSDINVLFAWFVEKDGDGTLQVGFIQKPNMMGQVVITNMDIRANSTAKTTVIIDEPTFISFTEKTFPLFDAESPNGRDELRDYAETKVTIELFTKRSPYNLSLAGYYITKEGNSIPFQFQEKIIVKRKRSIQHIADSWP